MRRTWGGYTIIEVIIVLAVSVVIFFAAVTVFSGKQGKTEFAQAMRDVASQIESVVNDVSVSTFPYADNYTCRVVDDGTGNGLRPKLSSAAGGLGTNTDCIFLGKAIFLDSGSDPDKMVIHSVLGRRSASGTPVTSFSDTQPEAADEIQETYRVPWGAEIKSAKSLQGNPQAEKPVYLMGYYQSLYGAGATQGSQSIRTLGYADINTSSPGQIKNAIRNKPGSIIEESRSWTLCFQSGTSNETAQVIVSNSFSGVTTQIKYTSCS